MDTIAVCAIFRDEAPYLLEWLAFHKLVGVNHFVLYDNNSDDGGRKLIENSRFAPDVTLLRWPEKPGQLPAYHHFCINFAYRFTWAAFIDIDEFMLPLASNMLPALLKRYKQFSAVLINWLVFGPSDHESRPPGLVTENYPRRLPLQAETNRHVKSLVRLADLIDAGPTPHVLSVLGPSCNARGESVEATPTQPTVCSDVLVVNHYFTKSREDWSRKVHRGRADTGRAEDQYIRHQSEMFEGTRALATCNDTRISQFVPRIRELIG